MTREIVTIQSTDFIMTSDWEILCLSLGVTEHSDDIDELVIEYVRAGKSEDELKTVEEILKTKESK
jgi:hypothetical protein